MSAIRGVVSFGALPQAADSGAAPGQVIDDLAVIQAETATTVNAAAIGAATIPRAAIGIPAWGTGKAVYARVAILAHKETAYPLEKTEAIYSV